MDKEKMVAKKQTMQSLQVKSLLNDGKKLAKVNDLWYFVKSDKNRWVAGSAH
ncbi:epipeptide YydF family RiPP [Macrococcus brunensis]|uniref:epipeptide YydF family RiPP n=1 Tax=Macrococcus brunensis TaxID=198483 RepID=UPI001EF06D66|nr:epipeptide YydF family RiPP [Macrococcus brunensis]ULG73140.1 epipeptide YydF family RiPP [Macrococcus brunensis]